MDPSVVFEDLTKALKFYDWADVLDCLDALISWILSEGMVRDLEPVSVPKTSWVPARVSTEIANYNRLLLERKSKNEHYGSTGISP
jgi:hypothetical protein